LAIVIGKEALEQEALVKEALVAAQQAGVEW
jgi:hypothetical protein